MTVGDFSLFDLLSFDQLDDSSLSSFFSLFRPNNLTSSVWTSLSSIVHRHLHPHPHPQTQTQTQSQPHLPPTPNIVIELPPDQVGYKGLFSHLRTTNSKSKITDLVKVTASSTSKYFGDRPEHVLEWNVNNNWLSDDDPGQWIDLDLKGKSFILNSVAFMVNCCCFPQRWHLSGFDQSGTETVVFTNVSDLSLNSHQKPVLVSVPNQKPFSRYKIVADERNFQGSNCFCLYSIELFGTLVSELQ
jgi:hypothetical protein